MINKKIFYVSVVLFTALSACNSVKSYNAHLQHKISISNLKEDVDFVQKKLNKNHPKLDLYVTRAHINSTFDSFKSTLKEPLLPNEFYSKFYPLVRNLKHGHTDLHPLHRKLDKKESKRLKNSKGVLSQFVLFWENDSIYLVKSYLKDSIFKPGSVLLRMDSTSPYDLRKKYKDAFYGDGIRG